MLARLGPPLPFGGILTAIVIVALSLFAWNALRRRNATWSAAVLFVGALLVVGCFVPPPEWEEHGRVTGRFGGHVEIPVVADAGAPLTIVGGQGNVTRQVLTMDCPTRCDFALGAVPRVGEQASARLASPGNVIVIVDGGPLQLEGRDFACYSPPFTLRLLGSTSCIDCYVGEYVVGEGVNGSRSITPAPSPVC